jgi:hypothetical protein
LTKTKIAGFDCAQVLAPLVIGITGHRDVREEDRKALEHKLKEVFLKLHEDYGASPLVLVTALAEGADRLAAEVALSLQPQVKVRLVVPIPMPIELYELDFDSLAVLSTSLAAVAMSRSSREEFHALLAKAESKFELELAEGNSYETIARPGPARDRQYELVGKYIAQQSQILIALWDGVDSERVGGTASVVNFQREGVPGPEAFALEAPEGFPVYHILTPRLKNPYPQGEVLNLRKLYPRVFQGNDAQAEKYYSKMFARLDEFNRSIVPTDRSLAKDIKKSKNYLLQGVREDELPAGIEQALNRYAVADALAIGFQQKLFWAQVGLHAFTFLAFFLFLLFVHLPKHSPLYWRLSAGFVIVVFGLWKLCRKQAFDADHEDYRAIAEGLRVKFFWKLAGIEDSVADHYLGKLRSELDWIRNGFRGWNVAEGRHDRGSVVSMEVEEQRNRLGFVRKYWIDDQLRYFGRSAESNLRYHECFHILGLICIVTVLVLGVVLGLLCIGNENPYFDRVAIGLEASLAAAALLHHFNNRMAYAEHAKQYNRMASLFARATDLLGKFLEHDDFEKAYDCVRKVGNEALTENGDWVLLHRERPLEVPHP